MRVLHYVIEILVIQCVVYVGWRQTRFPWVRFAAAQIFQIEAMFVGWFALIPFCLAHEWETSPTPSIKDGRTIDRWTWSVVGYFADNPEDGVSGQQAIVYTTGLAGPYMPATITNPIDRWLYDAWRAWCWSAGRNSCDSLKYEFAWKAGPPAIEKPYRLLWIWPMAIKAGYQMENGFNVPVFSPFERAS
jgi:hypothetical protein